jgi:hypothetical protein
MVLCKSGAGILPSLGLRDDTQIRLKLERSDETAAHNKVIIHD